VRIGEKKKKDQPCPCTLSNQQGKGGGFWAIGKRSTGNKGIEDSGPGHHDFSANERKIKGRVAPDSPRRGKRDQ